MIARLVTHLRILYVELYVHAGALGGRSVELSIDFDRCQIRILGIVRPEKSRREIILLMIVLRMMNYNYFD